MSSLADRIAEGTADMSTGQRVICGACGAKLKFTRPPTKLMRCPQCGHVVFDPDARSERGDRQGDATAESGSPVQEQGADPGPEGEYDLLSLNLDDPEYAGETIIEQPSAASPAPGDEPDEGDEHDEGAEADTAAEPPTGERTDQQPKQKKKKQKKKKRRRAAKGATTRAMWKDGWSVAFVRSTLESWPYMALSLLAVGVLVGGVLDMLRSWGTGSLLLNLVTLPMLGLAICAFAYPASCFWGLITSTMEGADKIEDWPESDFGAWGTDLLFVGYLFGLTVAASMVIASLQGFATSPSETREEFWQVFANEVQENETAVAKKIDFPGLDKRPEVESTRPVLRPGRGWWTVFGLFIILFPFVIASALDTDTPFWAPWSKDVLLSVPRVGLAWLIVIAASGALCVAGVAIFLWGASHWALLTFAIGSPFAAAVLLIYARLVGRLAWLIFN